MPDFSPLFLPTSVAHVGASSRQVVGRFNYTEFLLNMGYRGRLYPVNPKYEEVFDLPCYPSLAAIPEPLDLAILGVPAERCVQVLREVPRGKVKFVIIHTSGFGEIDKGELEEELRDLARDRAFRIVGPNCMGIYSQQARIGFWRDHWEIANRAGAVGFVSQSGGHGVNLILTGMDTGIFFDKVISLGNQLDVSINEVLEYMGEDESVRVIGVYVEEIGDGRRFQELLKRIIRKKPVVVWKGGVTEEGKEAAVTHTGSMAGNERIFDAAMRQAGVIRAGHFHQMARLIRLLQPQFRLPGRRLGVLSPGGGNTVSVCDLFGAETNLSLPRFAPETQEKLRALLPEENVDVRNPVDPGATGYMRMDKLIKAVAGDPQIDTVLLLISVDYLSNIKTEESRVLAAEIISETVSRLTEKTGKPIYVMLRQQRQNHEDFDRYFRVMTAKFIERSIPWIDGTFKDAAEIMSALVAYAERVGGGGV